MIAFEKVVAEGSFRAAAEALEMPRSTLSDRIRRLEERLGVQLLERTTRTMALTDAGATFYARCREIATLVERAEGEVHSHRLEPQGTLRLSVPTLFGRYFLEPVLEAFACDWPQVMLEVVLANRRVHLIEEGFDLAVRVGRLGPTSLRVRRLAEVRIVGAAAPEYLVRRGAPSGPEELEGHRTLGLKTPEVWSLEGGQQVILEPDVVINDMEVARDLAIAGLGLVRAPRFVLGGALARGELEVFGEEWLRRAQSIFAVYPGRRFVAPRMRVFLDALVEHLRGHPLLMSEGKGAS